MTALLGVGKVCSVSINRKINYAQEKRVDACVGRCICSLLLIYACVVALTRSGPSVFKTCVKQQGF